MKTKILLTVFVVLIVNLIFAAECDVPNIESKGNFTSSGKFNVTLYNGCSTIRLKSAIVTITIGNSDRSYDIKVDVPPLSFRNYDIDVFDYPSENDSWSFYVWKTRGVSDSVLGRTAKQSESKSEAVCGGVKAQIEKNRDCKNRRRSKLSDKIMTHIGTSIGFVIILVGGYAICWTFTKIGKMIRGDKTQIKPKDILGGLCDDESES